MSSSNPEIEQAFQTPSIVDWYAVAKMTNPDPRLAELFIQYLQKPPGPGFNWNTVVRFPDPRVADLFVQWAKANPNSVQWNELPASPHEPIVDWFLETVKVRPDIISWGLLTHQVCSQTKPNPKLMEVCVQYLTNHVNHAFSYHQHNWVLCADERVVALYLEWIQANPSKTVWKQLCLSPSPRIIDLFLNWASVPERLANELDVPSMLKATDPRVVNFLSEKHPDKVNWGTLVDHSNPLVADVAKERTRPASSLEIFLIWASQKANEGKVDWKELARNSDFCTTQQFVLWAKKNLPKVRWNQLHLGYGVSPGFNISLKFGTVVNFKPNNIISQDDMALKLNWMNSHPDQVDWNGLNGDKDPLEVTHSFLAWAKNNLSRVRWSSANEVAPADNNLRSAPIEETKDNNWTVFTPLEKFVLFAIQRPENVSWGNQCTNPPEQVTQSFVSWAKNHLDKVRWNVQHTGINLNATAMLLYGFDDIYRLNNKCYLTAQYFSSPTDYPKRPLEPMLNSVRSGTLTINWQNLSSQVDEAVTASFIQWALSALDKVVWAEERWKGSQPKPLAKLIQEPNSEDPPVLSKQLSEQLSKEGWTLLERPVDNHEETKTDTISPHLEEFVLIVRDYPETVQWGGTVEHNRAVSTLFLAWAKVHLTRVHWNTSVRKPGGLVCLGTYGIKGLSHSRECLDTSVSTFANRIQHCVKFVRTYRDKLSWYGLSEESDAYLTDSFLNWVDTSNLSVVLGIKLKETNPKETPKPQTEKIANLPPPQFSETKTDTISPHLEEFVLIVRDYPETVQWGGTEEHNRAVSTLFLAWAKVHLTRVHWNTSVRKPGGLVCLGTYGIKGLSHSRECLDTSVSTFADRIQYCIRFVRVYRDQLSWYNLSEESDIEVTDSFLNDFASHPLVTSLGKPLSSPVAVNAEEIAKQHPQKRLEMFAKLAIHCPERVRWNKSSQSEDMHVTTAFSKWFASNVHYYDIQTKVTTDRDVCLGFVKNPSTGMQGFSCFTFDDPAFVLRECLYFVQRCPEQVAWFKLQRSNAEVSQSFINWIHQYLPEFVMDTKAAKPQSVTNLFIQHMESQITPLNFDTYCKSNNPQIRTWIVNRAREELSAVNFLSTDLAFSTDPQVSNLFMDWARLNPEEVHWDALYEQLNR